MFPVNIPRLLHQFRESHAMLFGFIDNVTQGQTRVGAFLSSLSTVECICHINQAIQYPASELWPDISSREPGLMHQHQTGRKEARRR